VKTCVESSLRSRQLSESVDIVDSEFERPYKFPNLNLTVLVEILVHGVFRKSKIPKNGDNSRKSKNREHVVCATFLAVNCLEIL